MLNELNDQAAARYRDLYVPSDGKPWTPFREHRTALFRGLLANRDGDPAELRRQLGEAARAGVRLFARRKPDKVTGNAAVQDFEMTLMTTVVFGNDELRRTLAELPREVWYQPEDDRGAALAAAFDALLGLAAGADVSAQRAPDTRPPDTQGAADSPRRQPWDWIAPLRAAIAAIGHRDAALLRRSCATLLQAHEYEARHGKWRRTPEGLVALWPLALEALARERGMSSGLKSPYLPLAVLPALPVAPLGAEPDPGS